MIMRSKTDTYILPFMRLVMRGGENALYVY